MRATVSVPQAYQPTWVRPSKRSAKRLPSLPKQNRAISTVLNPERKATTASAEA